MSHLISRSPDNVLLYKTGGRRVIYYLSTCWQPLSEVKETRSCSRIALYLCKSTIFDHKHKEIIKDIKIVGFDLFIDSVDKIMNQIEFTNIPVKLAVD